MFLQMLMYLVTIYSLKERFLTRLSQIYKAILYVFFPNDKVSDLSTFNKFADDKTNMAQHLEIIFCIVKILWILHSKDSMDSA